MKITWFFIKKISLKNKIKNGDLTERYQKILDEVGYWLEKKVRNEN